MSPAQHSHRPLITAWSSQRCATLRHVNKLPAAASNLLRRFRLRLPRAKHVHRAPDNYTMSSRASKMLVYRFLTGWKLPSRTIFCRILETLSKIPETMRVSRTEVRFMKIPASKTTTKTLEKRLPHPQVHKPKHRDKDIPNRVPPRWTFPPAPQVDPTPLRRALVRTRPT